MFDNNESAFFLGCLFFWKNLFKKNAGGGEETEKSLDCNRSKDEGCEKKGETTSN